MPKIFKFIAVHQGGALIRHMTTAEAIKYWKSWVWSGERQNSVFRITEKFVEQMFFDELGRVRWVEVTESHGYPNVEDVPSHVRKGT